MLTKDYRKILDRKDIDVVTIVTPDHWHSKIAIEAMQAGKDIYCEKPLTLTINEGKQIIKVLDETKRVFQVGTQQRTEMGQRFIQAVAPDPRRSHREGENASFAISVEHPASGEIPKADVPTGLNWNAGWARRHWWTSDTKRSRRAVGATRAATTNSAGGTSTLVAR